MLRRGAPKPMISIRPARPEDYVTFGRMFVELAVPEPPPDRVEFESRHMSNIFFACDEVDRPLGYGMGSAVADHWHVTHVVTDPAARGRGVGRAIMDEQARRARELGLGRWFLSVKRENTTAIRLYERCGMRITQDIWAMSIDWADVAHLPRSLPFEPTVLEPERDAEVEQSFGLGRGEIAGHRARVGRIVTGAIADGRVIAFAGFDPAFPGAYPFRPLEPRWTHALLESIRPHARPEHDHVRLLVEKDVELVRTLTEAGARVLIEMYRMDGTLG